MSVLTPQQADKASQARARANKVRLLTLAGFTVLVMLLLAGLLQQQQTKLEHLVEQQAEVTRMMCEQRKANTIKTNDNWDKLAVIEQRNKFIDDDIRQARLKVYREAKLIVPTCTE